MQASILFSFLAQLWDQMQFWEDAFLDVSQSFTSFSFDFKVLINF